MVPDTYADLFFSYSAVWVCLALYIIFLGLRVSRLERTLPDISTGGKEQCGTHESSGTCCNSKR